MKSEFNKVFKKYLINLDGITGFDLNWNYHLEGIKCFLNFGMKSIYSLGTSGHDYLVYFILPGVEPENYPIAIYDEEIGMGKIISSSIKNWFPSYFIYQVNYMLIRAWEGDDWAKNDIKNIISNRGKIEDFCKVFENKAFFESLPVIFKVLEEVEINGHPCWNYVQFRIIAENGSYMAKYLEMGEKITADSLMTEDFRFYNKPFSDMLNNNWNNTDPRVSERGFCSLITLDMDDPYKKLHLAASALSGKIQDSTLAVLTGKIAEIHDPYRLHLAGAFYRLGKAFEYDGKLIDAIILFINAIYFRMWEEQEVDFEAFNHVKALAAEIKDENFLNYVMEFDKNLEEADIEENRYTEAIR